VGFSVYPVGDGDWDCELRSWWGVCLSKGLKLSSNSQVIFVLGAWLVEGVWEAIQLEGLADG